MQISARTMLRVGAALLAFAIIAGLALFANGLVGNPISRFLATRSARQYVAANYPSLNLELEPARYDFKSSNYYVHAKSPTSIDTHFTIRCTASGQIRYDDYDHRVTQKFNTYERIGTEYGQAVRAVIDAADFPYTSYLGYGQIALYYDQKEFGPPYGLEVEELVLDRVYDAMELAEAAGQIVLYVEDEKITVNRAAEILLDVRDIFDSKNVSFYAIDYQLIEPRDDDKPKFGGASISVREFLYEDIYEEGLAERLAAADAALREHYAVQDAKR